MSSVNSSTGAQSSSGANFQPEGNPQSSATGESQTRVSQTRTVSGPLAGLPSRSTFSAATTQWKDTSLEDAAAFSRRPGTTRYARIGASNIPQDAPFKLGAPMTTQHRAELEGASSVMMVPPEQLHTYRLGVSGGRIVDANGRNFDTRQAAATNISHSAGHAIFVMDHFGNIYATNSHKEGVFHHSSFLQGASVACAGELAVHDGVLKSINNRSGHYLPEVSHLGQTVTQLQLQGIAVTPDMMKLYRL
jgi:hypothetical protein